MWHWAAEICRWRLSDSAKDNQGLVSPGEYVDD